MRTLFLHCILPLKGHTTQAPSEKIFQWPWEPQACDAMLLHSGDGSSPHFHVLNSSRVFFMLHFPFLRLEQAQITKQDVWQGHIFYFSLNALLIKQFWQNYNGKIWNSSPRYIMDAGNIQGWISVQFCLVFGYRFQQFSAEPLQGCWSWRLFKATKPEGGLDEYLHRGQGFIYFLRPTWASSSSCLVGPAICLTPRHWSQFMSPWGLQAY